MTLDELQAIRDRHAATTPGAWRTRNTSYTSHVDVCVADPLYLNTTRWVSIFGPSLEHDQCVANAEFVAQAHHNVPALLVEVDRLRKALAEIEDNDGDPAILSICREALQ